MRIVLFTGKGGVGKTTTSAATALRIAERGTRTLLLSTDTAHSLGDALGVTLHGEPDAVVPGLWAAQIDTQQRLESAWGDVRDYATALLSRGGADPVTAEELTVLPGMEEVLALLAVREFAGSGNWDTLVVDCAPTAETLRLLALPDALQWYLDRIAGLQRGLSRALRPFAALLGHGDVVPPDDVFGALLRISDELAGVRLLLGDRAVTTVRLVLTPEAVVTAETRRTFTALALYGYAVDLVVANRVFPAGDDPWRQGWAAAQQRQLTAIRESFGAVPVREVRYREREPVGVDDLRVVADDLYGPDADPAPAPGADRPAMVVEPAGDGFRLRMALPLAGRHDVHATRIGDELVVTVGPHRRIVALPSVLRSAVVAGGSYDGAELRVRFRPDPALPPRRPRPRPGPRPADRPTHDGRTAGGAT